MAIFIGQAGACRCSRGFSHGYKSAASLLNVKQRSLLVQHRFLSECLAKKSRNTAGRS